MLYVQSQQNQNGLGSMTRAIRTSFGERTLEGPNTLSTSLTAAADTLREAVPAALCISTVTGTAKRHDTALNKRCMIADDPAIVRFSQVRHGVAPNSQYTMSTHMQNTIQRGEHQTRFDQTYITATEIGKEMGVSRTAVLHARRRGLLPGAIAVNGDQLYIWERAHVRPFMDAWKVILDVRRSAA